MAKKLADYSVAELEAELFKRQKCLWCERFATIFCDAPVGFLADGDVCAYPPVMWTCDAPVCDDHRKQVGWICGKEADSIDRCPHHSDHEQHSMRHLLGTEEQAESRRRAIFAEVRRMRIREGTTP